MDLFRHFGFQSGRDVDKFAGRTDPASENGLRYIDGPANALISGKVEQAIDCGTHMLYIALVTEARKLSDAPSMTYAYYFANVKPKPQPKPAEANPAAASCAASAAISTRATSCPRTSSAPCASTARRFRTRGLLIPAPLCPPPRQGVFLAENRLYKSGKTNIIPLCSAQRRRFFPHEAGGPACKPQTNPRSTGVHQARAFLALGFFLLIVAGGFVLTLPVSSADGRDRGHPPGDVLPPPPPCASRACRSWMWAWSCPSSGRRCCSCSFRVGGLGFMAFRHADHGGAGPAHLAAGPHDPARRHEPGGAQRHGAADAGVFPDRAGGWSSRAPRCS